MNQYKSSCLLDVTIIFLEQQLYKFTSLIYKTPTQSLISQTTILGGTKLPFRKHNPCKGAGVSGSIPRWCVFNFIFRIFFG